MAYILFGEYLGCAMLVECFGNVVLVTNVVVLVWLLRMPKVRFFCDFVGCVELVASI